MKGSEFSNLIETSSLSASSLSASSLSTSSLSTSSLSTSSKGISSQDISLQGLSSDSSVFESIAASAPGDILLEEGSFFLKVLLTQPVAMLEFIALVFTIAYLGRITFFNNWEDECLSQNSSSKNYSRNISRKISSKNKGSTFIAEVGALISRPKKSLLGQY